jgi:hypothetical protein
MIFIKTENWGNFKAADLTKAKDEFVNAIVNSTSNPDISIKIDEIDYHGDLLADCFIRNVERDIEYCVKKWHETAEIESSGLNRAQQESMEG